MDMDEKTGNLRPVAGVSFNQKIRSLVTYEVDHHTVFDRRNRRLRLVYYQTKHQAAPEYQTTTVSRGDLTQVVTATGQLGPVLNVQVGSQISGIVKKLLVDFNSVVKSNQLIAEIDPSTYEITVLKAEAGLANSKANLALARRRPSAPTSCSPISLSPLPITTSPWLRCFRVKPRSKVTRQP